MESGREVRPLPNASARSRESIRDDLHFSDAQLGWLATGFIVVYMLTSPVFGSLGDRRKRPPLIALGVAIWSVATTLAGFARGFVTLFTARATVGVGPGTGPRATCGSCGREHAAAHKHSDRATPSGFRILLILAAFYNIANG